MTYAAQALSWCGAEGDDSVVEALTAIGFDDVAKFRLALFPADFFVPLLCDLTDIVDTRVAESDRLLCLRDKATRAKSDIRICLAKRL